MANKYVAFLFVTCLASIAFAKKRIPNIEVNHVDKVTGVKLNYKYRGDKTTISSSMGKILWTAKIRVRKKAVHLSPKGRFLVLFDKKPILRSRPDGVGSKRGSNPLFVSVYDNGKLIKEVKFKDLFGEPPLFPDNTHVREGKLKKSSSVKIEDYITEFNVNWGSKILIFSYKENLKREIRF